MFLTIREAMMESPKFYPPRSISIPYDPKLHSFQAACMDSQETIYTASDGRFGYSLGLCQLHVTQLTLVRHSSTMSTRDGQSSTSSRLSKVKASVKKLFTKFSGKRHNVLRLSVVR